MKLAILGLPSSGKTHVFNALTGQRIADRVAVDDGPDRVAYGRRRHSRRATSAVGRLFRPKKTTPASVTLCRHRRPAGGRRSGGAARIAGQPAGADGRPDPRRARPSTIRPSRTRWGGSTLPGRVGDGAGAAAHRFCWQSSGGWSGWRRSGRREPGSAPQVEREQALFEALREALDGRRPLRALSLPAEETRRLPDSIC